MKGVREFAVVVLDEKVVERYPTRISLTDSTSHQGWLLLCLLLG